MDDQLAFDGIEQTTSPTDASVVLDGFKAGERAAASGCGSVHVVCNTVRKVLEKHYSQLSEVRLVEFDIRLLYRSELPEDEKDKGCRGAGESAGDLYRQ